MRERLSFANNRARRREENTRAVRRCSFIGDGLTLLRDAEVFLDFHFRAVLQECLVSSLALSFPSKGIHTPYARTITKGLLCNKSISQQLAVSSRDRSIGRSRGRDLRRGCEYMLPIISTMQIRDPLTGSYTMEASLSDVI